MVQSQPAAVIWLRTLLRELELAREKQHAFSALRNAFYGAAASASRLCPVGIILKLAVVSLPWEFGLYSCMNNKSVARRQDYLAFRVVDGRRSLAVIAAIRPGNHTGLPWAFWHSKLAPWGELKRVPGDHVYLGIDEFTAKRMINLISGGKSLPDEFIGRMPVHYVGVSDFSSMSKRPCWGLDESR